MSILKIYQNTFYPRVIFILKAGDNFSKQIPVFSVFYFDPTRGSLNQL